MGVKIATTTTTFLQWAAQPIAPHSPSSQTLASAAISSPSSKRRCIRNDGRSLSCCFVPQRLSRLTLFGTPSTKLQRSRSCELWQLSTTTKTQSIPRACSAGWDSFSDEEFSKKIEELALRFQVPVDEDDEDDKKASNDPEAEIIHDSTGGQLADIVESLSYSVMGGVDKTKLGPDSVEPPWHEMVHSSSIERKANSVDLPLSLRIIKRKLQLEEGVRLASESAYCSVKKAFSSMVFMIRELHSFTLQLRELLFYEDLQGILQRVQKEMHASFVWLFQQVFSHTPTLMVYVMILLANFTVFSMDSYAAVAVAPPSTTTASYSTKTEIATVDETRDKENKKFDSSLIKTFSVSSSNGKTTSIGGNNGGGGKIRRVASGTDGDSWFDKSDHMRTILPDGVSEVSSAPGSSTLESEPSVSGQASREQELSLWNSMVEESERMEARDEVLDHDTMKRFVSPVEAEIEPDDYADYFKTELLYQTGLSQEPDSPLLLANYAQFLYLVAHDYDRAEEYFKRAIKVEPADPEALSKYATFLWKGRKDLWGAEETFLEAISADPTNSYYSANYAHFLWNTGGEETCFPLDSPHEPDAA